MGDDQIIIISELKQEIEEKDRLIDEWHREATKKGKRISELESMIFDRDSEIQQLRDNIPNGARTCEKGCPMVSTLRHHRDGLLDELEQVKGVLAATECQYKNSVSLLRKFEIDAFFWRKKYFDTLDVIINLNAQIEQMNNEGNE